MWFSNPYQKHLCAFILFIGSMSTLITISSKYNSGNFTGQNLTNETEVRILTESPEGNLYRNQNLHAFGNKINKSFKNKFNIPQMQQSTAAKNMLTEIYILGLFELSTKWGKRPEGYSEMLAAHLAVRHVNEFNILPGYTLKLITNDTKCDPGVGVDRFFHALYSNKIILMLLGAGCSNVTESLANIVPYWNILQVSFGSTSPVLSDRTKFPLFFRTVAPDSSHNAARISFIKYFGWNIVATFSLSQQPYVLSLNNFMNDLEVNNISCIASVTFSLDNYKEQLRTLKELDTRIIFGSFSTAIAPKIFCEVYTLEMYGKDYVWILQDQTVTWWKNSKECDVQILQKAVEGLIVISDYNFLSNNQTAVSGLTNEAFEEQLSSLNVSNSKNSPQSYDAIWTMALTLKKVIACKYAGYLKTFSYKDTKLIEKFMKEMNSINFVGVSGPVQFKGADRIGNSAVKQIQNGNLLNIAIYYAHYKYLNFNCHNCTKVKWPGNQIPIAQRILKFRLIGIPKIAFVVVSCFAGIGISISLVFLYFNLHFRKLQMVKLSSPRLNNIVVLGCILVYLAVISLGLDHETFLFKEEFSHLCIIRVYLLCAGFSLTFGSIFAKTYRVHRIFTYSGTSLVKDKLLKDKQLIALVFVLLLIDGLILILWALIDPMERKLRNLPIEISLEDRGIVYQPQLEVCRSKNTIGWFVAIYSYKGVLLITGVYMAWETRHVKIPSLNDSQYIGICVYSVVASSVVVVLTNFLLYYTTLSYLITAISILISTTITLVQLFVPKLKLAFGRNQNNDTVTQSMGLKTEYNTRRLMFDDHRELLYRLEVQNRVYKSEVEALDKEICRLESLISSRSTSSMHGMHLTVEPFTISNDAISSYHNTRASWPSTSTYANSKRFLSDQKLHKKVPIENYFEKSKLFIKLKKFFGSIPSVCTSTVFTHPSFFQSKIANEEYNITEKPDSNPEVIVSDSFPSSSTKDVGTNSTVNLPL